MFSLKSLSATNGSFVGVTAVVLQPNIDRKKLSLKTPTSRSQSHFKTPKFSHKGSTFTFSLSTLLLLPPPPPLLAVLQLLLRRQTPTWLPSLMSLRKGPGTAAKLSELPGKSLSGGLALGGPKPKRTYSNALKSRYFPEPKLPDNVISTTDAKSALLGADYCLLAVPVQFCSSFLEGIVDYVDPGLPFISLSKGLELNTLRMMSQIIPRALKNPRQPFIALSGPSFAPELMNKLPTAMVVASKDKKLAIAVQQLLASSHLRISTSSDVTGVEIAGAIKNVLAIAAGIVDGMNLGNNSMAALVVQGWTEIR
ncbi:hypothetical protein LWI29_012808 [Acer saccharum]|uniref:Glycerol-3-phosphate dehydrogenase [NAD(+)] n=1 Tax=Acer saccharum TaxID=4024 RepID=A0AA39SJI9_ACESA|nr:hypothetical protein LWI29_012808 [Acer saccharum]